MDLGYRLGPFSFIFQKAYIRETKCLQSAIILSSGYITAVLTCRSLWHPFNMVWKIFVPFITHLNNLKKLPLEKVRVDFVCWKAESNAFIKNAVGLLFQVPQECICMSHFVVLFWSGLSFGPYGLAGYRQSDQNQKLLFVKSEAAGFLGLRWNERTLPSWDFDRNKSYFRRLRRELTGCEMVLSW